MSIRAAAEVAGISEGWWRQVVRGFRTGKGGVRIEVDAPADTLAAMADAVGVDPGELRKVGRDDAARKLELLRQVEASKPTWDGDLSRVPDEDLTAELARRLEERAAALQGPSGHPPLGLVARRVDPSDGSTFGGND